MGQTQKLDTNIISGLQVCALEMKNIVNLPNVYAKNEMPVSRRHIPTSADVAHWPHLQDINLPQLDTDVGLLIGNNVPGAYSPMELRTGPNDSPHATRSALGWIVWNVVRDIDDSTCPVNSLVFSVNRAEVTAVQEAEELRRLDLLVRQSISYDFPERIIDDKKEHSVDDRNFLKQVQNNLHVTENDHYQMDLPFRDQNIKLPDNHRQVLLRLGHLKNKLMKNSKLKDDYKVFMDNLFSKDYAEPVSDEDLDRADGRVWYIPHHGVYHPHKPDKVPILDRDCLRFYWWPNGDLDLEPVAYRMTVHLFGATSSPSCANAALKQTAIDHQTDFPAEVSKVLNRNFYVDDCLVSKESEEAAIRLLKDVTTLCSRGGFNLTKWLSNKHQVLESVPIESRAKDVRELDLECQKLPNERALGVMWLVESDSIGFRIQVRDHQPTRRGILATVSSVYDPLGLAAPAVLTAKILLQSLCKQGIGWDDPVSKTDLRKWENWVTDIPHLEGIDFQRCYKPESFGIVTSCQLHMFSDASDVGYGVAAYLRFTNDEDRTHCCLVLGKSRVAPLKRVSIPRLELTAATTAVKLSGIIIRELEYTIDDIFFWTDNMSVLRYIANEKSRFHTFVANRVTIIHEASTVEQWRYVPTASNPADAVSRGKSMSIRQQSSVVMWTKFPGSVRNNVAQR